jgi:hypothetical protein
VRRASTDGLSAPFGSCSGLSLVDRLRVTKAFLGFSRLGGTDDELVGSSRVRRDLLWRWNPGNWLPAALVFGEGILLEFDAVRVAEWAARPEVIDRRDLLIGRYTSDRGSAERRRRGGHARVHRPPHARTPGGPRARVLQRLQRDLDVRARLCRPRDRHLRGPPLHGGRGHGRDDGWPRSSRARGPLDRILRRTVERAEWCSIDPVCTELGDEYGQGPNACNLAACYACAVVPETTCDDFNRFLDRGMLIAPGIGLLA